MSPSPLRPHPVELEEEPLLAERPHGTGEGLPHYSVLRGQGGASLSRGVQIPQEFICGNFHVSLPCSQGSAQVISDNDLEPEELHHERFGEGLVDLTDKANLL